MAGVLLGAESRQPMELWGFELRRCAATLSLVAGLVWASPLLAEPQVAPAVSHSVPAALQVAPAASNPSTASSEDVAASQFANTCAGCHTIGAGASRGPDLAAVVAWPESQLQQAVKSMERKVGPLTSAQIDAYVVLLKDANARDRVAKAKARTSELAQGPVAPADSLEGGALFFGQTPLVNGGMPCNACHRFHGEGGDLGPDLTRFATGTEVDVTASTIARASFPVMKGAYELHPITQQEARHLAAFLIQARAPRMQAALAETKPIGLLTGIGAFGVALAWIVTRSKGVRARLVQRATKR